MTLLNLKELKQIKSPGYLIDKYLVRNSVVQLFSPRGAGKSFLAIDWAMHVAAGKDWLGHKVTPGNILYVIGEGLGLFPRRVSGWEQHHSDTPIEGDRAWWWDTAVNLGQEDEVDNFLPIVEQINPVLIIFDTQARCTVGVEENSAKDSGIVIHHLERIRDVSEACVLLLHHTGWEQNGRGRGSSAVEAALQTVLGLEEGSSKGQLTLRVTKQKDDEEEHPLNLVRQKLYLDDSDESTCVIVQGDDHPSISASGISYSAFQAAAALAEVMLPSGTSSTVWLENYKQTTGAKSNAVFYRAQKAAMAEGLVVEENRKKILTPLYFEEAERRRMKVAT